LTKFNFLPAEGNSIFLVPLYLRGKYTAVRVVCPAEPRLIPKDSAAYLTRVAPEDGTGAVK